MSLLSLTDSLIKHQVVWKSILSSPQVKSKAYIKKTMGAKLMLYSLMSTDRVGTVQCFNIIKLLF